MQAEKGAWGVVGPILFHSPPGVIAIEKCANRRRERLATLEIEEGTAKVQAREESTSLVLPAHRRAMATCLPVVAVLQRGRRWVAE